MAYVRGIDVSKWQPTVDWVKVRGAGVAFAIPKASQATWADPVFPKHWHGARDAGLLRGAYHFFTPDADPVKQLDAYMKALGDDLGDFPPVFDIECKTTTPAKTADAAFKWVTEAEKRTGRKPIIYTAAWYWNNTMNLGGKFPAWAADYPLWVAAYPLKDSAPALEDLAKGIYKPLLPKSWTNWVIWQYSEKGRVDGVVTDGRPANTDLNVYQGSLAELGAWLGLDAARLVGLPEYTPEVSFSIDFVESTYGDASETRGRSAHAAEAAKESRARAARKAAATKKPAAKKPAAKAAKKKPAARKPAAKKPAARSRR